MKGDIIQQILSLNSREDVKQFYSSTKLCQQDNETRQSVANLMKQSEHAFEAKRFDEAYQLLLEAGENCGDFTPDMLERIIEILAAAGRFEEAGAFAYVNFRRVIHEKDDDLRCRYLLKVAEIAYKAGHHDYTLTYLRQLGRSDKELRKIMQQWSTFFDDGQIIQQRHDDANLEATMERLLTVSEHDFHAKMPRYTFLAIHASMHISMRRSGSQAFFRKKSPRYVRLLADNKALTFFLSNVNFEKQTLLEAHFLQEFLQVLCNWSCLIRDKGQIDELFGKDKWFSAFLKSSCETAVTDATMAKLARCQPGSMFHLYDQWLNVVTDFLMSKTDRSSGSVQSCQQPPLGDVLWFARLINVFLYEPLLKKPGIFYADACEANHAHLIITLFKFVCRNETFQNQLLTKTPTEKVVEMLHLMALETALNYADCKESLIQKTPSSSSTASTLLTDEKMLKEFPEWWCYLFTGLKEKLKKLPGDMAAFYPAFQHFAIRLQFLARNLSRLNEKGRENIMYAVQCFMLPITIFRGIPGKLEKLADDCPEVASRLAESLQLIFSYHRYEGPIWSSFKEYFLQNAQSICSIFCLESKSFLTKQVEAADSASTLIVNVIKHDVYKIGTFRLLAVLLRTSADENDRRKLSSGTNLAFMMRAFSELGRIVLYEGLQEGATAFDFANLLLCMASIIGGKQPIFEPYSVVPFATEPQFKLEPDKLMVQLCLAIRGSNKGDAVLCAVISSCAAILMAALAKCDQTFSGRFKKMKSHHAVITDLRAKIDILTKI